MDGTGALITVGLFLAAFGVAGIACWIAERRLQKKQVDWRSEANGRGAR